MSASIAELPVFFNNISELQDYIYNTLSVCNDKAEKLACIEIFKWNNGRIISCNIFAD